jgi:mono/diheme cytochrome c family protein
MKMQSKSAILVLALLVSGAMSWAQSGGEATFKAKCQMCHGATGEGETPAGKAMKVKPFSDPVMLKMSDATIVNLTKNGSGKMPAFKDKLTDSQIKEVVEFIHELQKKK